LRATASKSAPSEVVRDQDAHFALVFERPFDGQVAWFRPDLPDDALDERAAQQA
jgi:hypothetical protein